MSVTAVLRDVVYPVVNMLRDQAGRREMTITIDERQFHTAFPVSMNIDRVLVKFAMHNLVKNAIRYGAAGSAIEIFSSRGQEGSLDLCVKNEGFGVSADEERSIFESFTRGRDAYRYSARGAGLGLHIVKTIMRKHRGRVYVRRAVGPTIFVLEFPDFLEEP